jgi:anti-sigma regulatory factor (Ser/Thr protein kinase)
MSEGQFDPASSPRAAQVLSMVLTNKRRELARLGELIDQFGQDCGLSPDDKATVYLTLDELVSNIIKYGYDDTREHQIHVTVTVGHDLLTISIEDDGKPFNPSEAPSPNLDLPIENRPVGGLGVYIVKSFADVLDYRRERGRNIVRVEKRMNRR